MATHGVQILVVLTVFTALVLSSAGFRSGTCGPISEANATIDSNEVFPKLGFRENWIYKRTFWNEELEKRYKDRRSNISQGFPLKVIVVPHSHNDPGWLRTFEGYFESHTKAVIDNIVTKLVEYPEMRFIWSEISFLSKWWETASGGQRETLKLLAQQRRLEIVTGGWVMADEATVNLYSMVDQLIEGHEWVRLKLGVVPKVSWSVDPFGHGAPMPYILKRAGFDAMVIQRVHYAWKKWFAMAGAGDFEWVQRWDGARRNSITCHNAPFDIYSIQHSCGPNHTICKNFDFRDIPGEFRELWSTSVLITDANVKEKADLLLEQYGRTASLFPHNVALIALGNDFRFEKPLEWDQQYLNYKKMFDHINTNRARYLADVSFGTPSDYFQAIAERTTALPTFKGDFFPYSDIFSNGWPGYWTGYFSTRPFYKKLYRKAENELRSAEILYTAAFNRARQRGMQYKAEVITATYNKLVTARRWLALFAHHDATTGTSKEATMEDYREKLEEAIENTRIVQSQAVGTLLTATEGRKPAARNTIFMESNAKLQVTRATPYNVGIFNSLPWRRAQPIKLIVSSPEVKVIGPRGRKLICQINPVLNMVNSTLTIAKTDFELTFIAILQPLALTTFQIRRGQRNDTFRATRATIYCHFPCQSTFLGFPTTTKVPSTLGNDKMEIQFDPVTGMVAQVRLRNANTAPPTKLGQEFGAYASYYGGSGAYLFKPDLWTDRKPQVPFNGTKPLMIGITGPLSSELVFLEAPILQRTRIYHRGDTILRDAITMENTVDLDKYNAEVYLRFNTDLDSTTETASASVPTFYTDQNGFSIEKRVKVASIGLEGNYYPVNTMAFIQDPAQRRRFSVLTDHSHGFSSFETGRLEALIERRTPHDDSRGMQEGVTDNRPTTSNYILLLESVNVTTRTEDYRNMLPTLKSYRLSQQLNYPPQLFIFPQENLRRRSFPPLRLLSQPFPSDSNLLNLRTISGNAENGTELPSKRALMVLQKLAFNFASPNKDSLGAFFVKNGTHFSNLQLNEIKGVELTGSPSSQNETYGKLSEIPAEPFDLTSVIIAFK